MTVLAFNASPRKEKGNTALILNPFLDGMRSAGAEVELFYVKKLKIAPCLGCFNCWLKTPGECVQKDDMLQIVPKMRQADIVVYATPVYSHGMTGQLKNLIDRMVSIASPFIEVKDGRTRHFPAEGEKTQKTVLVSNCGLWGLENFTPLLTQIEAMTGDPPSEFAGALLRPHGEALRGMLKMGAPVNDVVEAATEAGRQLVQDGTMSPETLRMVSRELLPMETYVQMVNEQFQLAMDKFRK